MNVFVLNTGRCGSTTFIEACRHITNYTAAHESRSHLIGVEHFAYPPNHIEADNRLSWFLGVLEARYGDQAAYVHLLRDEEATVLSLLKQYHRGIVKAYRLKIIYSCPPETPPMAVCQDYYRTVNANIVAFLRDKTMRMTFSLESAKEDFERFWHFIGAKGDLAAALAEWNTAYNASATPCPPQRDTRSFPVRAAHKCGRIIRKFPDFLQKA
jgi:hypothetical protein